MLLVCWQALMHDMKRCFSHCYHHCSACFVLCGMFVGSPLCNIPQVRASILAKQIIIKQTIVPVLADSIIGGLLCIETAFLSAGKQHGARCESAPSGAVLCMPQPQLRQGGALSTN